MFRSYLNREAAIYLGLISLLFIFKGGIFANFLWFLFLSLVIFIFRQNRINLLDNSIQGTDLLVSPVNGTIQKFIREDNGLTHLLIKIDLLQEIGIYLPVESEILDVKKTRGKSILRWSKPLLFLNQKDQIYHFHVELKTQAEKLIQMEIFKCFLGIKPSLSILGGDRGQKGARMGFMPFGGTVLLTFSSEVEFLINEKDQVVAGETLICRLK
jgi:hypothetical protein